MKESATRIPMAGAENAPSGQRIKVVTSPVYDLYGGAAKNILSSINKSDPPPESNQGDSRGVNANNYTILPHPMQFNQVIALKDISTHHGSCIQAKKYSTVGLGFYGEDEIFSAEATAEEVIGQVENAQANVSAKEVVSLLTGNQRVNSKVDDLLDPLTFFGFQNELTDMVEDFMDTGTGYLEVVRDSGNNITGIRHLQVATIHPVIQGNNLFYKYSNPNGNDAYFALYGRKDWLLANYPGG